MTVTSFEVPYISHNQYYKRKLNPLKSFPFQPDLIPQPLISDLFFTERVNDGSYLRHVQVSFFCLPVYIEEKLIPITKSDGEGNLTTEETTIKIRYVEFSNEQRTVAYELNGNWTRFIDEDLYDGDVDKIPNSLQQLYIASDLTTPFYLKEEEDRIYQLKINQNQ
jgi:hypothetical protein